MSGYRRPALDEWIAGLPPRPDRGALADGFVPPPRFQRSTFESYQPDARHPSQAHALVRLRDAATRLRTRAGLPALVSRLARRAPAGSGIYLDGGFGVGKTHLLAALWHAAPGPKAFLSFDELVYTIGLLEVGGARAAFRGLRLAAVDEWELDDPGNLTLALAWLRGALADGLLVVATSNTIPDELGRGRFSQKTFAAEINELAAAFDVLTIGGEDYRHRHFQADPGREFFLGAGDLERLSAVAPGVVLEASFAELLRVLDRVHPIHFAALVERIDLLLVSGARPIPSLNEGLRWVHFVDKLYDAAVPMAASGEVRLSELFPASFFSGGFAKKFGRCLSRMEELLGDAAVLAGTGGTAREA